MNVNLKLARIILSILISFCVISSVNAQSHNSFSAKPKRKQVATWIVYDKEKNWDRINKNADVITSLSVFGDPPKEFIDHCHNIDIEVYYAVGGNASSFDTPSHLKATIDEYLKACNEKGYDGIDLDFEHLAPEYQEKYSEFLKAVSFALHKSGKKLSHCVGFYPWLYENPKSKEFVNHKVVGETCDMVRLMVYDMYFAPGINDKSMKKRKDCQGMGPTSSYPFAKTVVKHWMQEVPREKLIMGLPAYSNDYIINKNVKGAGVQVYSSKPQVQKGTPVTKRWLWYEKVNLYTYQDKKGNWHLFYASDADSTRALLEVADEMELPGIGFWHFSSVDQDTWTVIRHWLKNK